MDKRSYLIEAVQARAYTRKHWIMTIIAKSRSLTKPTRQQTSYMEGGLNPKDGEYPYKLYSFPDTKEYFFRDPNDNYNFKAIDNTDKDIPLFTLKERITLSVGELENVVSEVETNIGTMLINAIIFVYAFGAKIPYMKERFNPTKIENYIAKNLRKTPGPGEPRDDKYLYVDEYLKFAKAASSLAGLSELGTPASTPKSITINPAILKRRDELFEEHKDDLSNIATVAKIEKELTDMDKEDLKDDKAMGFLIADKNFTVSRKRMFIMHGVESGFGDTSKGVDPIRTSLNEGWDIKHMPAMVNSLRAGSFNRGNQTALGGESVKFFYRVFQNTRVLEQDCGSKHGLLWKINEHNYLKFVGLYLAAVQKTTKVTSFTPTTLDPNTPLTEETAKALIGKHVLIRTPMLCKTKAPSFCARCVGDLMAATPTGVHIAMSDVGSIFMLCFMKAMHGKALKTAVYDYNEAIT